MSTIQYLLWSSCSVQSLIVSTRRIIFCWFKSATVRGACTLWMSLHHGGNLGRLFWFGLLWRLMTTFVWVFHCFSVFWTISDTVFKVNNLPTCDFLLIYLKERYKVSGGRPFPFLWQCRLHIRSEYWKRSALVKQKGSGLWDKSNRCSSLQTSMNWWYKGH